MDSEVIAALDDSDQDTNARLNSGAPFSPPSLSVSQYKQLELLQHLALYSELAISFSGEKGMGKTFIAHALIASREDPDQSLMVEADFLLSYSDILHQIAQYMDLAELDDIEALESRIVECCQALLDDEQGSFLLIIDNADQLTNEVLFNLNQLASRKLNAIHVMFLGTPFLDELLLNLPEPHALVHSMQSEYLTESESEVILLEQFPHKDWSGEQVDYMLKQAKGNPGKLMYIAQQLAEGLISLDQDDQKVKSKFPITHIAAMLLVASVLVVSFLYKNSQTLTVDVETFEIAKAEAVSVASTPVIGASNETEISINVSQDDTEEGIDFNFVEPAAVITDADLNSFESNSVIASPVVKINTTQGSIEPQSEPVSIKQPASDLEVKAVQKDLMFSLYERRLLDAKSTAFVAQLFASYAEKSAQVFIKGNKSTIDSLMYYRTEYKGKPWFVVVSGPFESKAAAKADIEQLPAKLRSQNPWVRSIGPIQALLNTRS